MTQTDALLVHLLEIDLAGGFLFFFINRLTIFRDYPEDNVERWKLSAWFAFAWPFLIVIIPIWILFKLIPKDPP